VASIKQVKYAKDLLRRNGMDPEDYMLGEVLPGPVISPLLNKLKAREGVSAQDWNASVARYFVKAEVTGPGAFAVELLYIRSLFLRDLVFKVLGRIPEYFYEIPASSTGNYHPNYALGVGGLLRHTKAAVMIADSLFDNPSLHNFDQDEKDIIISALILHDTVKHGVEGSRYSVTEHPLLVEQFIDKAWLEGWPQSQVLMVQRMIGCIRSHMGPWTTDRKTQKDILPKPHEEMEKFTHLADYLASRKFLEVAFS
jgi:hypothetical protein